MIKPIQNKMLHPLVHRAKTLLILVSAVLVVANLYTLNSTRELARSYTDRQNQATWFLFQQTKEFTEMMAETPYALNSKKKMEHVWLKYELTWSRFDVILNSREAEGFMGLEGTYPFFKSAFEDFKLLEPLLMAAHDKPSMERFLNKSQDLYQRIISYINENFKIQSPIYLHQKQQAYTLTQIQFVLMFVLFSCIGLVSYILHAEARFHKLLALTDPLTGLSNRLAMFDALKRYTAQQSFSLLLLDLNGFKAINDTLGHQAGDSVLRQVAHRLAHIPTFDYWVFRMGGDEFAIILDSVDPDDLAGIQTLIAECFEAAFVLPSNAPYPLSTSIGVSRYPYDAIDINQLVHIADKNMYQMKFQQKSPS
ncbi:GGDEF domain-containing protein [Vibrio fluvialis]|nr:GGDEF domain-containing protein [Vibrio fluvialis]